MKIVCMSDTHNQLDSWIDRLPEADVLVHAGDLSGRGRTYEIEKQLDIMAGFPYKHKVFIAGNHDFAFEGQNGYMTSLIREKYKGLGMIYLQDSPVVIEGVKFYGAPWTPNFYNWAFMPERGSEELHRKWKIVPEDVDVLITHGPPHLILDKTDPKYGGNNVGCELLREEVLNRIKPKVHVFGHIHGDYGILDYEGIKFVNAASCDRSYDPTREPLVVEISTDDRD